MRSLFLLSAFLLVCVARADGPVRIEGEDRVRTGGPGKLRVIEREGTFGGKVLSYWDDHGTWAEWEFDLPAAGSFAVSFRYAAAKDTTRCLWIDGAIPEGLSQEIAFPATGTYAVFALHTLMGAGGNPLQLELSAGKHTLRMTNVDSTGLAVDAILLHSPSLRFVDQLLTAPEVTKWQTQLPEKAISPVFGDTEIIQGTVAARLGGDGRMAVVVGGTLFSVATEAAKGTRHRTRNLWVYSQIAEGGRRLLITDGQAVSLVAIGRGVPMELRPEVYRWEARLTWPAVWRQADGQLFVPDLGVPGEAATEWSLGGVRLSCSCALRPRAKALRSDGATRVAAVKLAPVAWREAGMQLSVSSEGAVDTIASSAQPLPGIAAFYGYTDFRIRLVWDGERLATCELTDLASGERVPL